jgi:hypothetical protein
MTIEDFYTSVWSAREVINRDMDLEYDPEVRLCVRNWKDNDDKAHSLVIDEVELLTRAELLESEDVKNPDEYVVIVFAGSEEV